MGLLSRLTGRRRTPPGDPIDITGPEFKANPYPYFARLRAESPVRRVNLRIGSNPWLVTRYDDVVTVLRDERFVKASSNALTPEQLARQPWFLKLFRTRLFTPLRRNLINVDPPDHTRLRGLVTKAFTPRRVEQMQARVQKLADELFDAVQARGSVDLVREYALPMPTTIIAEMLGVPPEDRPRYHRWTNAMAAMFASKRAMVHAIPNVWALMRYTRALIRKRRADPRDDLISSLIAAEEAGDTLSEDELLGMMILLLVAGYETTANLVGSGVLALLEHPDQLERLRNDPSLIRPALEELLRYTSPADMASARYAREDVTIAGVTIPRGEAVFAAIASANRDDRQFQDPDTLDIAREPNKHLSFGLGTHFCLGAALARLEGQIAIGTVIRRAPDLRLAVPPGALRWRPGLLLRGLTSLPVVFGSSSRPIHTPHRTRPAAKVTGPGR